MEHLTHLQKIFFGCPLIHSRCGNKAFALLHSVLGECAQTFPDLNFSWDLGKDCLLFLRPYLRVTDKQLWGFQKQKKRKDRRALQANPSDFHPLATSRLKGTSCTVQRAASTVQ